MIRLIAELKTLDVRVWRYKIEDCMLDSRHDNELKLLGDDWI